MFDYVTSGIPKETLKYKGIKPIHVTAFFEGLEDVLGQDVVSELPDITHLVKNVVELICEEMALDLLYMSDRTKTNFWAIVFTTIASFMYWSNGRVVVHEPFLLSLKTRFKCKNFYLPDNYGYGYGRALGFSSITDYPTFLRVAHIPVITKLHVHISQKGVTLSNPGLIARIDLTEAVSVKVSFSEWRDGERVEMLGLKSDIHEVVNGIIDEIVLYVVVGADGRVRKQVTGSWESFDYHLKIKNAS